MIHPPEVYKAELSNVECPFIRLSACGGARLALRKALVEYGSTIGHRQGDRQTGQKGCWQTFFAPYLKRGPACPRPSAGAFICGEGGAPMQVIEIEHCWIPMADGIRLSARLWLPSSTDSQPAPAILEYIPYRKRDLVRARDQRNHPVFAANGFAGVRVDMRGSGDSEGLMGDMYEPEELDDAVAAITWIAAQPWCNGAVGMMGTSWGGTSALQAAVRRPPALKAIIAVCATDDHYGDDIHHSGGCLLTDSIQWGATLPAILALPPDPGTVGQNWRRQWQQRLEQAGFPLQSWLRHPFRDDYWRRASVNACADTTTCPTLLVGGWTDRYSNTVMNLLARRVERCWGVVGPWGHHYPDVGEPGPAIDFQQLALDWWNHWLKETPNGVDQVPRLRVWMQTYAPPEDRLQTRGGRWISERHWPSPGIVQTPLWLGDGRLQAEPPGKCLSVPVPDNLKVGLASGDTGYFGREGGLPLDQSADDSLSLVLETDPLSEPVEILGSAQLQLNVESKQPLAALVARLNDVPPAGGVQRVCWAVRNLDLADNDSRLAPESPGQAKRLTLHFPNTAYRFEAGHRIRLALSSSYWPLVWPSPQAAGITIHLTPESRLILPVRPAAAEPPDMLAAPLPPAKRPSEDTTRLPASIDRWERNDPQANRLSVGWKQALTWDRFPAIGVNIGSVTKAEYHIEPACDSSAQACFEHELRIQRNGCEIKALCSARVLGGASAYTCQVQLHVMENDVLVFQERWESTIERVGA